MKIVNINYCDKSGGAAIAAYRHNEALRICGYDSSLLVLKGQTDVFKSVISITNSSTKTRIQSRIYNKINIYNANQNHPYGPWAYARFGFDISHHPAIQEADIIILHWVNQMLSIKDIEKLLSLGKPVYWFMHDMWPFTGGCHHSLGCTAYQEYCGKCPRFNNNKGSCKPKDLSFIQLRKKLRYWSKYNNLNILAPSKWLADCSRKSALFGNLSTSVLRNVIDTGRFKPIDKDNARKLLNLPKNKFLLLFGADYIISPYKGWTFLQEALSMVGDIECVIFGQINNQDMLNFLPIKVHYLGKLADDYSLISIYNACDAFVIPSIAENYPNVLIEAMACQLPCVGFNIGGIPEIISHKISGYISNDITAEGLASGINWIVNNEYKKEIGNKARQWVIDNSSYLSSKNNHSYDVLFHNGQ